MLTFEILADPIPLSRPKFSGHRAYLPARSREYRELVQVVVQSIMRSRHIAPLTGELNCRLSFYRRFKTTARNFGDIDNHVKAILDALNGLLFHDDAQIVSLTAEKFTDRNRPRTVIAFTNKNTAEP